jgi:hypothetical protein
MKIIEWIRLLIKNHRHAMAPQARLTDPLTSQARIRGVLRDRTTHSVRPRTLTFLVLSVFISCCSTVTFAQTDTTQPLKPDKETLRKLIHWVSIFTQYSDVDISDRQLAHQSGIEWKDCKL